MEVRHAETPQVAKGVRKSVELPYESIDVRLRPCRHRIVKPGVRSDVDAAAVPLLAGGRRLSHRLHESLELQCEVPSPSVQAMKVSEDLLELVFETLPELVGEAGLSERSERRRPQEGQCARNVGWDPIGHEERM
jgi:hypothetical protein